MAKRKRSTAVDAVDANGIEPPRTVNGNAAKSRRKSGKNQEEDSTVLNSTNAEQPDAPAPAEKPTESNSRANDPEADDEDFDADPAEVQAASLRPPPVNSSVLPLPWKGRLGYACLNTYLRNSVPPVFCSRTTRIASILDHRHPLKDPSQPEHPTKNRPDKDKPADVRLGQKFVENLCLANVRDMAKMLRWNDRYGIKFLRLSSEAFPFASHAEYGYKLEPFAAEELAKVGKVAAELGHRVTTHPGQFTQLGSPRQSVIDASFRDLEYHDEMLSLLKLPPQQDRDAVMILHMGGAFGDKQAALDRFRENYSKLSDSIKRRLVLENDDVVWSVHDLLPICKELNIPFVLDFHHNNIIFDADKIREGTEDIQKLFPEIIETWRRKDITPKMHHSEPTPPAITGKQRRKHNPRPATLPPCPNDMDLMIEAKDKEQAVFELMRNFKLPGWDTFNNIVPYVRDDINKPAPRKKATPRKKGGKPAADEDEFDEDANANGTGNGDVEPEEARVIPEEEIGMGGPLGRVYWPPGMEEWLRPVKRVVKKKEPDEGATLTPANRKIIIAQAKAELAAEMKAKREQGATEDTAGQPPNGHANGNANGKDEDAEPAAPKRGRSKAAKATVKAEPQESPQNGVKPRASARASRTPRRSYKETDDVD